MMSSEDRKRLLMSEFELIDTNHDLIFNKADLIRYLDEKNFDRHLANELFDKMEKDKDDRVSANEFLHIWDECHDIITDNIQICDARIKLATESKEKLNEQIKAQRQTRGQQQSQPALRLVVREARSVNFELFCVLVKLGSEMRQTSTFGGSAGMVTIQQYMEFPKNEVGPNSSEYITFRVLDINNPSNPPLEGQFSLAVLNDQLKHEVWINLQRMDGLRSDARVAITLQHLYSEEKYFTNLAGHWDQYAAEQVKERAKNENYLKQINNPNNFLLTVAHGDFYIKRLTPTQELTGFTGVDHAYRHNPLPNTSRIHPMEGLALIFGLAIIITCLFNFAYRAAFDSCFVGGMLIGFFYLGPHKSVETVVLTAGTNFVAIVMNITWLIMYYSNFWSGDYIDSGSLLGPRRWEVVLAIVLIALEVLTMLLLLRLFWICKSASYYGKGMTAYAIPKGGPGYGFSSTYHQNNFLNQWNMTTGDGFFIERPNNFNPQYLDQNAVAMNATGGKAQAQGANTGAPGSPQPAQNAGGKSVNPFETQAPATTPGQPPAGK